MMAVSAEAAGGQKGGPGLWQAAPRAVTSRRRAAPGSKHRQHQDQQAGSSQASAAASRGSQVRAAAWRKAEEREGWQQQVTRHSLSRKAPPSVELWKSKPFARSIVSLTRGKSKGLDFVVIFVKLF